MDPASVVALVVATISAVASLASVWYTRRANRLERLEDADQVAVRFREPLLQAAFNLQSRLYNIVHGHLLQRLKSDLGTPEENEYVIENTLYLLGQYFCWVEILRRESQFIDPRNRQRDTEFATQLERVRDTFAESENLVGPLRVFRGEQRAIAEKMLVTAQPGLNAAPRWDSIGFARFIESGSDPTTERWFRRLRQDLELIRDDQAPILDRLVQAQHELVRLIDVLDPLRHRITILRSPVPTPTTDTTPPDGAYTRTGNGGPSQAI